MKHRALIPALASGLAAVLLLSGPAAAQSFEEALVAAYRSNPRLLAERERVKEADEQWVQARALGRPTASANVSAAPSVVRTPNTGFFGAPAPGTNTEFIVSRQAGVQVIQPIYQGGRVSAQKRQAKSGILAARENLRNAEQSVLQQAANAYIDVVRNEEAARIRRNNVSVLLRQKEASTARFEVGEGTRTDIAQADARLSQARIGLAQADAELQASRAAFQRAVGVLPEQLGNVPRFVLPGDLEEAQRIAAAANPQLMAAYLNEAIADASVDIAKSAGKPTISLNGDVGLQRESIGGLTEAETARLTAQVTIPLLSGGANRSRVRQAKHARNRASFEARDIERALRQTVMQVWAQIVAADISLDAARDGVAAAEVAFEGVELEQQVGTRTALDVLDAEQELLNARLSVVDAERSRNQAVFQLLGVLGAFDADALQLPVTAYDPRDYFEAVRHDGYEEFVDTYVPEAVEKIGSQVPDLVEGVVVGPVKALDAIEVLDAGGKLLEGAGEIVGGGAVLIKEGVDTVTLQNRPVPDVIEPGETAGESEAGPDGG